ncbi:ATP-dependent Lon protease pim1 [Savitreella phatthalungensis]
MVWIAAGQICSTSNILRNLEHCVQVISKASRNGARCVFLPEAADYIARDGDQSRELARSEGCGEFVKGIQAAAREHKVHVNVGVHAATPGASDKLLNQALWINDRGDITHTYTKLHLFDVDIRDGPVIKESKSTKAGDQIVTPFETPVGKVGMAICFDVRFPELSLKLRELGAQVLLYPSAFAVRTGQAHWETLLRARAIETSSWVVAAAQAGRHNENRVSWGHSMIVDPWGSVVAQATDVPTDDGPTYILADIDLGILEKVREGIPLMRRTDVYGAV